MTTILAQSDKQKRHSPCFQGPDSLMENSDILGEGKTKYYGKILEQGVAGVKQKV